MSKKNSLDIANMKRMEDFNFELLKEYSRARIINNEYTANENMIEEYKKYKNLGLNHKDACKKIGSSEYKFARMLKDMGIPSLNRHSIPAASSKKGKKITKMEPKAEPKMEPIKSKKSDKKINIGKGKILCTKTGETFESIVTESSESEKEQEKE